MYGDTITIFNREHSKTGDIFYPHVLYNVELQIDKAEINTRYGAESKDNARLFIRYSFDNDGNILINDILYLPPKEYALQNSADKEHTITFNDDANYFDFFILGDKGYTTPILDSNYAKGFYNELNNTLDNCYAITSVSGAFKGIPHYEILGK